MNTHHVWRPRMERDPLLNPFAPVTQRSPNFDHVELGDIEAEEGEGSSEPAAGQSGDPKPEQE
jgi:hypothetical protein